MTILIYNIVLHMAVHPFSGKTSKKNDKEENKAEHILHKLIDYNKVENITNKSPNESLNEITSKEEDSKERNVDIEDK